MTTLNPQTVKKANKAGLSVTVDDANGVTEATGADDRHWKQQVADASPADFVTAVIGAYAYEENPSFEVAENEAVRIEQTEDADFVARLVVGGKPAGELARDPVLADLLDALRDDETETQANGIREDLSADDEDEDDGGSVVPETFKKRYAEAGHPTHCGDWLAVTLNSLVQVTDGKKVVTDLDRLEAIANANDVAPERVDRLGKATNGWQGRYRMTVRNMLAKRVADKGFLFVPEGCGRDQDTEIACPADWRAKYATRTKAKKVVDKDPGAGKAGAATVAKRGSQKPKAEPTGDQPAKPARKPRGSKADKAAVAA